MESIEQGEITRSSVYHEDTITIQGFDTANLIANVIVWLHGNPLLTVLDVEAWGSHQIRLRYIDMGEHID